MYMRKKNSPRLDLARNSRRKYHPILVLGRFTLGQLTMSSSEAELNRKAEELSLENGYGGQRSLLLISVSCATVIFLNKFLPFSPSVHRADFQGTVAQ